MKYFLIFISLFFMLACTTTKPTITEFKLNVDINKIENSSLACRDKTIKVSKAFSNPSLVSLKMDYVQGKNKVFTYTQSQWVESPRQAVSKEIYSSLRDSGLFKYVNIDVSRSVNDYIIEIIIEDFMQYYNEDLTSSYANVKVNINVINLKDSSVVASKTFSSKVDTKTLDASGGVQALTEALSNVVNQNIEWLNGVCK